MQANPHWQISFLSLVGAGLLLPIIAAALYVSGKETPLAIDSSTIVAEGSRGSEVTLDVLISNRANRSIRVLGASTEQSCLLSGCAKQAPDLPMEIKGHESRMARVVYKIGWQDNPPYVLTFYTDCVSQPELSVTIKNKCKE